MTISLEYFPVNPPPRPNSMSNERVHGVWVPGLRLLLVLTFWSSVLCGDSGCLAAGCWSATCPPRRSATNPSSSSGTWRPRPTQTSLTAISLRWRQTGWQVVPLLQGDRPGLLSVSGFGFRANNRTYSLFFQPQSSSFTSMPEVTWAVELFRRMIHSLYWGWGFVQLFKTVSETKIWSQIFKPCSVYWSLIVFPVCFPSHSIGDSDPSGRSTKKAAESLQRKSWRFS